MPSQRGASRALTLAAMGLGFALVQLDVTVVNVALERIGASVGGAGGVAGLQWVVNAYTIAFAGLILTSGALGDRLGAKRLFIAGFALFVAASMACGAAPSLLMLILARAVQGIGAALFGLLIAADRDRFISGLHLGLCISAAAVLVGALTALIAIRDDAAPEAASDS